VSGNNCPFPLAYLAVIISIFSIFSMVQQLPASLFGVYYHDNSRGKLLDRFVVKLLDEIDSGRVEWGVA